MEAKQDTLSQVGGIQDLSIEGRQDMYKRKSKKMKKLDVVEEDDGFFGEDENSPPNKTEKLPK